MNDDIKAKQALRAQHTCMREMTSMHCLACARGVPYPALTIEEIQDALGEGHREAEEAVPALYGRPGRRR